MKINQLITGILMVSPMLLNTTTTMAAENDMQTNVTVNVQKAEGTSGFLLESVPEMSNPLIGEMKLGEGTVTATDSLTDNELVVQSLPNEEWTVYAKATTDKQGLDSNNSSFKLDEYELFGGNTELFGSKDSQAEGGYRYTKAFEKITVSFPSDSVAPNEELKFTITYSFGNTRSMVN